MERFPKNDPAPLDQMPADGNPAEPPLQFGLRSLLILQAVVAGILALLITLGVVGVMIVFVFTAVQMGRKVEPRGEKAKRLQVDLLAGVLLPLLCLVYDPFVFQSWGSSIHVLAYLAIGLQILLLIVWQMISLGPGGCRGPWAGFFAGALAVGFLLAAAIAVVMLPISVVGLFVLIGLLGFTPFLTAYVFLRNVKAAMKRAADARYSAFRTLLTILGLVFAVAVPLATWLLAGDEIARLIQTLPTPRIEPYL